MSYDYQKPINFELGIRSDTCHEKVIAELKPSMSFSDTCDLQEYTNKVRAKMRELLGLDLIAKYDVPVKVEVKSVEEFDTYTRICFLFNSEKYYTVPCFLLIPKDGKQKHDVLIALQGHTSGVHISLGVKRFDRDDNYLEDSDFGMQALKHGYACCCIEQRGLGMCVTDQDPDDWYCNHPSLTATLMGRTVIGERVWDVSKAIDALEYFGDKINLDNIGVFGNSGGGTASYYSVCNDERIKFAFVSCGIATFDKSIVYTQHCSCNYVPNMAKYFEMGDIACLVAPRKLCISAGIHDPIFLIDGVKEQFSTIEKIYTKAGCRENLFCNYCELAHKFDKAHAWDIIAKMHG